MDWSIAGGSIEAGTSARWWLYWESDPGTQIIEARPIPFPSSGGVTIVAPAELMTSDQTLKMEVPGYTYSFTVSHVSGFSPTNYVIVGKRIG